MEGVGVKILGSRHFLRSVLPVMMNRTVERG